MNSHFALGMDNPNRGRFPTISAAAVVSGAREPRALARVARCGTSRSSPRWRLCWARRARRFPELSDPLPLVWLGSLLLGEDRDTQTSHNQGRLENSRLTRVCVKEGWRLFCFGSLLGWRGRPSRTHPNSNFDRIWFAVSLAHPFPLPAIPTGMWEHP